jgi:acylaminoacyl-peptidase
MQAIRALEGQVGTLDVQDCLRAADWLLAQHGYSRENMFLYGGSHGGFLVAHLSCRPEHAFRACAAINAVIDFPGMSLTSDIPDFAWGQNGLPYDLRAPAPPGRGELEIMRLSSPSSRVHLARTPTVLLLGANDLRVPASQGMAWHAWLKARGVPTEAYLYPGTGHAIDSAEGEFQELYQTYRFFAKYR